MPGRRILLVNYTYPPMPSVGANRWAAMVKYLERLGHDVMVLTTSAFGTLESDQASGVVRSPDLAARRWVRGVLRRPPLPEPGGPVVPDKPPPSILTRVLVPDAYLASWVPFAGRIARRMVGEGEIDCLITSSPFESTHLLGLALRRRVAWLADFEDGWCFEPVRPPFPTGAQRALDRWLERRVVEKADGVLAVTGEIASDFRRRFGVHAAHLPNGWDPDLEPEVAAASAPPLEPGCDTLVHTGKLSGVRDRDPAPLFSAIRLLLRDDPELRNRLRLLLIGRLDVAEERLLAGLDLDGVVRSTGHLPRPAAVALQRQADALVLLTSPSRHVSEATGKLFEYLVAGRPILALAEGNEAERMIRETGTGITVAPDDPAAIARAVRQAVDGELARAYAPRGLDRYVFPAPAKVAEAEIERALSRIPKRGRRAT